MAQGFKSDTDRAYPRLHDCHMYEERLQHQRPLDFESYVGIAIASMPRNDGSKSGSHGSFWLPNSNSHPLPTGANRMKNCWTTENLSRSHLRPHCYSTDHHRIGTGHLHQVQALQPFFLFSFGVDIDAFTLRCRLRTGVSGSPSRTNVGLRRRG